VSFSRRRGILPFPFSTGISRLSGLTSDELLHLHKRWSKPTTRRNCGCRLLPYGIDNFQRDNSTRTSCLSQTKKAGNYSMMQGKSFLLLMYKYQRRTQLFFSAAFFRKNLSPDGIMAGHVVEGHPRNSDSCALPGSFPRARACIGLFSGLLECGSRLLNARALFRRSWSGRYIADALG
jgi:hypothetical protein